jgi:hypothetical protein
MPFTRQDGQQHEEAVFLTDDQFMHEFLKENHTLPAAVLAISSVATFLIVGYRGFTIAEPGAGLVTALGACVAVAVMLGICCLVSTGAGWVVCKMFGEDYGSAGALFLRFGAVAVAQFPVFAAISALVGGLLSIFLFLPVMLALVVWIAGLDLIRAFLFTIIQSLVSWLLVAFVFMSLATAISH